MRQEELILIILGVVIVGIALAVGINMFMEGVAYNNREAITADLNSLVDDAMRYYRWPDSGRSFNLPTGEPLTLEMLSPGKTKNDHGTYSIKEVKSNYLLLCGIGTIGYNGQLVEVHMHIWPDSTRIETIN